MTIRTLIIDDEPHAIEVIDGYLANFPEIEVVDRCATAIKAFKILQSQKIDLLFLDIKMPGLTGTDLMRSLHEPPRVIFTTAFQEYALDGFELNAIDYLMKPVPFDRFLKAMNKVMTAFRGTPEVATVTPVAEVAEKVSHYLYLKTERRTSKVETSDIYWIESVKDYIKVVLKDRSLMSKHKISVIEKLLPLDAFVRIHRSFIVPLDKIECFHPNYVQIQGKEIPIGRNYKADCHKRFRSDD
ncbi:response regulator transcription factor [Mucilaginibacter limnophilus]|uniref:Response regulator transcription factor n=1 Tax=Mucilaginibacter limnophilus TaxID=1932778 RepID=A0A437MZC8_9SPHI|nr:response regulator transcription factor [Mucilaginibacter limnophilus]RVU02976.1 response regulator transcription factor [Mucilaginibacter limnophilus]